MGTCTFMFEEVVRERVVSTQKEYSSATTIDLDSLSNIKKLLDDARASTKQHRDRFFVACETLLDAKTKSKVQTDPQTRKAITKARKAEKIILENLYRESYVFLSEKLQE